MLRTFNPRFFSSAANSILAPIMDELRRLDYWKTTCGSGHEPEMRPQPIPEETVKKMSAHFGINPDTKLGIGETLFSSLGKQEQDSFLASLTCEHAWGKLEKFEPRSTATDTLLKSTKDFAVCILKERSSYEAEQKKLTSIPPEDRICWQTYN